MKNCEQLSKEIMEKIHKKERAKIRAKKIVRRVFSVAIIVGFLIPATLLSITDDLEKYRPLSFPFEKEEPVSPDEKDENEASSDKDGLRPFEIVLFS